MFRKIKESIEYQKLKQLHESMVWTLEMLVNKDESEKQVSFLREIKRKVILRAMELNLGNHAIPILPVIPRNCMSTMRQMSFIQFAGNSGQISLNLSNVVDVADIPHFHPYWIFGIDLGIDTINMPPEQAIEKINKEGRHPLTLSEAVSLELHHCSLDSFSVNACGSRYENARGSAGRAPGEKIIKNVPTIFLENNIPTISWNPMNKNRTDEGIKPWITPSCVGRIGTLGIKTFIQGRMHIERRERREKLRLEKLKNPEV